MKPTFPTPIATEVIIDLPLADGDVEAWLVNTLKLRMLVKLDKLLEAEGKKNARTLLLCPVFTIAEFVERIDANAPELRTYVYRELSETIKETRK